MAARSDAHLDAAGDLTVTTEPRQRPRSPVALAPEIGGTEAVAITRPMLVAGIEALSAGRRRRASDDLLVTDVYRAMRALERPSA